MVKVYFDNFLHGDSKQRTELARSSHCYCLGLECTVRKPNARRVANHFLPMFGIHWNSHSLLEAAYGLENTSCGT